MPFPPSCAILPLAVEAARPRPLDVNVEEVPRIVPDSGYRVMANEQGRRKLPFPPPGSQGQKPSISEVVSRPADAKRGRLPRKSSGNPYGALAQLVVRYIRIVEVRGSTPLCSTQNPREKSPGFFFAVFRPFLTPSLKIDRFLV